MIAAAAGADEAGAAEVAGAEGLGAAEVAGAGAAEVAGAGAGAELAGAGDLAEVAGADVEVMAPPHPVRKDMAINRHVKPRLKSKINAFFAVILFLLQN